MAVGHKRKRGSPLPLAVDKYDRVEVKDCPYRFEGLTER